MVKDKVKFALWLTPETREIVETHFQNEGGSRSEYIEEAIRFYSGYLDTQNA